MNLRLRLYSCMFVTATTIGAWAQAPASGTYHIRSAQGTYVEVKGKYYAKPDASTTNDYTQIGVGVGYKDTARGGGIEYIPSRARTLMMVQPLKSTIM